MLRVTRNNVVDLMCHARFRGVAYEYLTSISSEPDRHKVSVTHIDKGRHVVTHRYKGLQAVTHRYKGLQAVTHSYEELQAVTHSYKG